MTTKSYTGAIDLADRFIRKYGGSVFFHYKIDGEVDSVTGINNHSDIVTEAKAVIMPYNDMLVDGDNIRKEDKEVIIAAKDISSPNLNDDVKIGDTFFRIINIKEAGPNVTDNILYKLQVRAYAPSIPIDVLRTQLGKLEPGTIVEDPSSHNDLRWVVIAQRHHGYDLTTLISEKIWTWVSFDGSSEGASYFPDTPWNQSYMYSYLHGIFVSNHISADLSDIMRTTSVETQGNTSTDKISLISREEVEGIVEGTSSGKHIPYFDSNTSRIARWYDDDGARVWWTRDVRSWDPPSGIIVIVKADGATAAQMGSYGELPQRGVRPMIYLSSAREAYVNQRGVYEILY